MFRRHFRSNTSPIFSLNLEDALDDKTAEDFIYGNSDRRSPTGSPKEVRGCSQLYSPNDDEFLEIPSSAGLPPRIDWREAGLFHGQESYSSFGEKGTTASVSAYGNILKISRYLGIGTSGIFCADPVMYEPWFLGGHMKELLNLSTDAEGGFGLCLNPELAKLKPRLQFLHGRWPRYTRNIGDLSVSIQYFANRGTVIQQYSFQRTQEQEAKDIPEGSDPDTLRGVHDDVIQSLHENDIGRSKAGAIRAQESQVQHDRNQNQPSSEDYTAEGQTEHSLPQNKHDKPFRNIQKKTSITDCLRFESWLQIRESEWANPSNAFNMDYPHGARYHTTTGQNQYSLVSRHQIPATDQAVALVIAVFVNGRAMKITESCRETYKINLDCEDVREFEDGWESKSDISLEITVAYKLRLMAQSSSWKSTLIPVSVLNLSDLVAQNSYDRRLSLSTSDHFNFIMKRHLEHILSVCSIPVSDTPIQDDDYDLEKSEGQPQAKAEESEGGIPIALTCGDISGHHVLVSASLYVIIRHCLPTIANLASFAFQFLLAIYSLSEVQFHPKLGERILETLKGHLEWVFQLIEKDPDDSSLFLAGYWANGHEIKRLRKFRNPQHTSLQIIMAKDFAVQLRGSDNFPSWFVDKVGDFIEKWIASLRKSDSRDYCIFQRVSYRGDEEGYYLRDHFLIWKALGITEVLEKLGMDSRQNLEPHLTSRWERQVRHGVYTSNQARRRILKRFTTQNPMNEERTIATYRDTRDNSFFLDTMDTILFYDEEKFFCNTSQVTGSSEQFGERKTVLDEWIRTLNVQTRHERTDDDKDWQEPLQYVLAIHMARYGHQIDSRPINDVFDGALKVLLQSCSASGIFPGVLTPKLDPSATFKEGSGSDSDPRWSGRDSYWHTSFELPYILWMYAKERLEETSDQEKERAPLEKPASANQRKTNKQPEAQMDQPIHDQSVMPKFVRAKTVLGGQDFTDQKNVFEISDEWLVPCPEFLHFDPKRSFKDVLQATTQPNISGSELARLVIDIPKRRNEADDQTLVEPQPCTSEEFFQRLQQWRTKKANMLIKKRIIWLSSSDKEAVAICPATVPESEQPALTGFFRKHNNWDKSFLDDPSARNNSWKTEFQLSFYQLEKHGARAQPKPEIALAKRIRRASMGFRFNGDFFDCYWTCHIINFGNSIGEEKEDQSIEADESMTEVVKLLDDFVSRKVGSSELTFPGSGTKKRVWHQRKVLELILFEKIISKVTAGTQEILEGIKDVLNSANISGSEENETIKDLPDKVKETVLFSKIDGNAYFSFSAQWEVIQQLLQVLDEDLSDTVKRIENWQDREKDRGTEKPRWTKKDEKRYRPALRRMQLSNAESVQGLLQLQEKVQSLRASLISRRDYIRDDLNLRGAENTRYFTYVTVVFLPLGFATGIFSMSDTPAGSTLARMSGTAAITFLLTVVALYFVVNRLEAVNKLRATSAESIARANEELEKLFLPLFFAYVLWRVLGGSISNFFNGQKFPSLPGSNDEDTDRRDSTASLPEGSTQSRPVRQRRPASHSGDLESQIRSRHSPS